MAIGTKPLGRRDFDLVVDGSGTAISDFQLTDFIFNFSMKCDDAFAFEWDFIDGDGFSLYGGQTNPGATGPQAGPVNTKCRNFKFQLSNASPGTYSIRVYVR